MFLVRVKDATSDLRCVNKDDIYNFYIMPESIFNDVFESQEKQPESVEIPEQTTELIQQPIKYDADFILEFARILLNRR